MGKFKSITCPFCDCVLYLPLKNRRTPTMGILGQKATCPQCNKQFSTMHGHTRERMALKGRRLMKGNIMVDRK